MDGTCLFLVVLICLTYQIAACFVLLVGVPSIDELYLGRPLLPSELICPRTWALKDASTAQPFPWFCALMQQ